MNVCAVIVTYANRFVYLKKVIDGCLREGVDRIVIVDNGSEPSSINSLRDEEKNNNKLTVIYNNDNLGSSGGYKIGLEFVYSKINCDNIWLLDDDNVPQRGALKVLKELWRQYSKNKLFDTDKLVLLSYREDRSIYKLEAISKKNDIILGKMNGFLGFNISKIFHKIVKLLLSKFNSINSNTVCNIIGNVSVAPYGGMFFSKSIIDIIGYPDDTFFVYADDFDWSYRVTLNNGQILLVENSVIEDVDKSWNVSDKKVTPFYSFLNTGSDFRIFYTIRNRVFFDQKRVKSRCIYNINMHFYLFILWFFKNKQNKKRFSLILNAIENGLSANLGKIEFNDKEVK